MMNNQIAAITMNFRDGLEAYDLTETFLEHQHFLVFFVVVKSYRSILSLLLLSAYSLLLLHDYIPHTHHDHQGVTQGSSTVHQNHGDHHHTHKHHEEDGTDDKVPDSPVKSAFGDYLIQTHRHSGYDVHHHDLAHLAASKDEFISKVLGVEYPVIDFWKLPEQPDDYISWQFEFQPTLSNHYFSSGHGLRAPPVLG